MILVNSNPVYISCVFLLTLAGMLSGQTRPEIVWPTPNPAWVERQPLEEYAQPTISGHVESALFGCSRTNGTRFHEGIDLKATQRDRRGEATDAIFAVMAGVVRHVNPHPGSSSYGRYIVIEHTELDLPVVTLYAHLASIRPEVSPGLPVRVGQIIGVMGRSAGGYTIPRERAHLHFEMGFWMSEDFQSWYDWKEFGSRNTHGNFNGMNIIGFDPLGFYESFLHSEVRTPLEYLNREAPAFTLRIVTQEIPDFVRRYPVLLDEPVPPSGVSGWEVDFTWYGFPQKWRPLTGDPGDIPASRRIEVIFYDEETLRANTCRATVRLRSGAPQIGSHTERTLQLLFGFR
ncbi:MAG: M23 family metallopeptidase [Opitutales bacterium]